MQKSKATIRPPTVDRVDRDKLRETQVPFSRLRYPMGMVTGQILKTLFTRPTNHPLGPTSLLQYGNVHESDRCNSP